MTTSKPDIESELIAIATQLLIESQEPFHRTIRMETMLSKHLGMDSLTRAELFRRIEKKFAIELPDQLLASASTLNDIALYLQSAPPHASFRKTWHSHKPAHQKGIFQPAGVTTLIDTLKYFAEHAPSQSHIFFQHENGQEEIITYGELYERALIVAGGLRALGVTEQETVAIMQPTSPHFFYTFYGTLLAGAIPVPIYPPFRMHMLEAYAQTEARILKNAQVRVLITFQEASRLSQILKSFVPSLKWVVTPEDLQQDKPLTEPFDAKPDDAAFIQYTSGSTSDPKGVLLSHANLIANIKAYGKAIQVGPEDVTVSWLPLYHDMGLIGMWLGSLYFGVPLVLLTPFSFLNHPEKWLWAIHYHRGTLSGAPNFAYELCIRKIDPALLEGLDLSSWRVAVNGAEKIYPRTLQAFAEKFAPYGLNEQAILPVYGLAESTVALLIPQGQEKFHLDQVDRKQFENHRKAVPSNAKDSLTYVSCGEPIEGHEVRIVDEQDQPLPDRTVGQLQFRGPSSMQGYYRNEKATQAVLRQGWINSGDFAYQADGAFYLTGRVKDLIIKAGRNLYPAEIEEIVGRVQGIRQGSVIAFGTTDPIRGTEQLIVVAETRATQADVKNAMKAAVQAAIDQALDIVPDHIILVAPYRVPKTSSGKLQRAACKQMYLEGRLAKKQAPAWLQVAKLGAGSVGQTILLRTKQFFQLIYTSYLFLWICLSFPILYAFTYLVSPITYRKIIKGWSRFILRIAFCPLKVKGQAHLTSTPMIYASNHASYIDPLVLITILPLNTLFVGKAELLSVPFLRSIVRKLQMLPVNRLDFAEGLQDTKTIEAALNSGASILIFPEGTFSYAAGLRPFRLGAFKIAAVTQTPICPIALKGTRFILRDDEKLLKPHAVWVTINEPITPSGNEWQDVTKLRNAVRAEIAKHCGEPSLDFIAAQTVASKLPPS
ncbi:MAG: AMP-binding protein [Gammaproteobacteria bacterium]|nr:AMP-binding protein [Gammaproteobacteria bacterium]